MTGDEVREVIGTSVDSRRPHRGLGSHLEDNAKPPSVLSKECQDLTSVLTRSPDC